jgi:anti-anti-sigma factor
LSAAIPGGIDPALRLPESDPLARLRGAPGEGVRIRVAAAGGRTLLRVCGTLDAAAAPALGAALAPYRQGRHWLILDLRSVEYIETPALRLLLAWLEELPARGGALCLVVQPHSRVERTLQLVGLDKRCPIVPTARQAWKGEGHDPC